MNPSRDFTNRCGNCGRKMEKKDKYCRFCGTKRGDGEFNPRGNEDQMCCLYGPPVVVKHICGECGFKWIEHSLGSGDEDYCPKCGAAVDSETEYMW